MTKIDIISGFLGAGKTTLIKRLLKSRLSKENVILIENEFGEIGIDSGFLKETKVEIKELNQGCICCSLQGDFSTALAEIQSKYNPDRIIIEPSGVGKLSDIVKAVVESNVSDIELNALVCVCDASKAKMYLKNFGEFYVDQVKHAKTIFLSRADVASEAKMQECLNIVRENNQTATIVTTSIDTLSDEDLINAYEAKDEDFEAELLEEVKHMHHHHHHHEEEHDHECCCHHEEEHDHECCCHHEDEHDHECCCHHEEERDHECCCHHDEEHDHECCCHHEEEHDHECCCHHEDEHDHECCCHHEDEHDHECECGHHHHHDGCSCGCDHDADEVFVSYGIETTHKFNEEELKASLEALYESMEFGFVLRAKGIVDGVDGWYHFDMVPGEVQVRHGQAASIGKICVIGSNLDKEKIKNNFIK